MAVGTIVIIAVTVVYVIGANLLTASQSLKQGDPPEVTLACALLGFLILPFVVITALVKS